MKYIKRYQQIFESSKVSYKYLIKEKNWEYELGYVYSPNLRTWSHYRDPSVNKFTDEDNGFGGLVGYNFGKMISEHFGVPSTDLCTLVMPVDMYGEFSFIKGSYLTKRNFVIVEVGKNDYLIKEYDKDEPNFKRSNYKNLIMDVVEYTLTDDELDDISSWHVTIQYYETNGIKYISHALCGLETYIFKKSDFESIIDMTKSCSYYRYVDKEKQSLRISNQYFNFLDIKDIFLDVLDNGITLEDFSQLGENKVMVMFKRDNIVFSEFDIDVLDECLIRFEDTYSCKFDRIDISRSKILYTNTHEYKEVSKEYNKVSDLLNIGELKYDEHLRIHYLYFVFNLQ